MRRKALCIAAARSPEPHRAFQRGALRLAFVSWLAVSLNSGPWLWAADVAAKTPPAAQLPLALEQPVAPEVCAAWIDHYFDRVWAEAGITPAAETTDLEFVRRVHLDLIGRIPSVAEIREFLADERTDRRQRLVEDLLQRGAFAAHLGNTWRDLLLAGRSANDARAQAPALETWLKLRFSANMPYDQLVRELLTAPLEANPNPRTPSPVAFYQAAEFKPEQLAANVSRVFLGVQVQCAQCHDHPFASWKQPQFWSFAAFFKNLRSNDDGMMLSQDEIGDGIRIPEKDTFVPAAFLDGSRPTAAANFDPRLKLAQWITGQENPFFDRAVVNRVWATYFGRGFVHPVDDLEPSNAPIHPAVFDVLATQFRWHRRDLKYLVRVITATKVYQRSSRGQLSGDPEQLAVMFAQQPLRRMTSDQIYAGFVQATGYREPATPNQPNNPLATTSRDEFLAKFGDSTQGTTEIETTILQSLSLMNGRYVIAATSLDQSEVLAAIAETPFLDDAGRLKILFLATLSRPPTDDEQSLFLSDFAEVTAETRPKLLADAFWTLLNSAEFLLNH